MPANSTTLHNFRFKKDLIKLDIALMKRCQLSMHLQIILFTRVKPLTVGCTFMKSCNYKCMSKAFLFLYSKLSNQHIIAEFANPNVKAPMDPFILNP